jgi:hydroxyethylthiazole kinase-like uncharacterized protein yjeF
LIVKSLTIKTPPDLLTAAEMGRADALTIAGGTADGQLMERAGEAVAREAARLLVERGVGSGRIAICCGPGNNGGDGFVAARWLATAGFMVEVGLLGHREKLKGDAAAAAQAWRGTCVPIETLAIDGAALVIDALFGAGLDRDLAGAARAAVETIASWRQATGRPVVAVDVPSGLDGTTGRLRGIAPAADRTVTFFRLKPGHVLMPGRALCGTVRLADIGIPASVLAEIGPQALLNTPAVWGRHVPLPGVGGHKYTRGHAVVVAGPPAQTGAARLAARGALRGGAGLVTVATSQAALPTLAVALEAIMTRLAEGPSGLAELLGDKRKNAVLLGPGLGVGEATRVLALTALGAVPARAVVLDADVLTSFAGKLDDLAAAIAGRVAPVVLTPHAGEFAHLFEMVDIKRLSKIEAVRAAAKLSGAIVVLKGADTVVGTPGGAASVAFDPPPWLATAGTGDVLAGMVCGLLAQNIPAFAAASAAVWLHGAAARKIGPGLIAEDLPEALPSVFGELKAAGLMAEAGEPS